MGHLEIVERYGKSENAGNGRQAICPVDSDVWGRADASYHHFYFRAYMYTDWHPFLMKEADAREEWKLEVDPKEDPLPPIDEVKKAWRSNGWEGDGRIGVYYVPPFAMPDYQAGVLVWHVKQNNNGTSFLASFSPFALMYGGVMDNDPPARWEYGARSGQDSVPHAPGTCRRCGKPLYSNLSASASAGPICSRHLLAGD